MIYTHAQILLWGLRYGWPGLTLSRGVRLRPGRESYEQMDSDMVRLVSAKIADFDERMPSYELSERVRIEVLSKKIIRFERSSHMSTQVQSNDKLKAARQSRKWTLAQAAKYLQGITSDSFSDWEKGRRPNERNIERLCALFHKTREELGF